MKLGPKPWSLPSLDRRSTYLVILQQNCFVVAKCKHRTVFVKCFALFSLERAYFAYRIVGNTPLSDSRGLEHRFTISCNTDWFFPVLISFSMATNSASSCIIHRLNLVLMAIKIKLLECMSVNFEWI